MSLQRVLARKRQAALLHCKGKACHPGVVYPYKDSQGDYPLEPPEAKKVAQPPKRPPYTGMSSSLNMESKVSMAQARWAASA